MSQVSSLFAGIPGIGTVAESVDTNIFWGTAGQLKWGAPGEISANALDPTNSPTWRLRSGLIMARLTASNQWINYSASGTDGSQNAQGVLATPIRMQDVLTGSDTAKYFAICIGGNLKAANLIGLDAQARIQMSGQFTFDDQFVAYPNGWYWGPYPRFTAKTANYTITAADNFTEFNNTGAGGEVDFTLPAIAPGLVFGFRAIADFTFKVISAQ